MNHTMYHVLLVSWLLPAGLLAQSNVDITNNHAWSDNVGETIWRDTDATIQGVVIGGRVSDCVMPANAGDGVVADSRCLIVDNTREFNGREAIGSTDPNSHFTT